MAMVDETRKQKEASILECCHHRWRIQSSAVGSECPVFGLLPSLLAIPLVKTNSWLPANEHTCLLTADSTTMLRQDPHRALRLMK